MISILLAVQDYCYTLDIEDRVWTAHSLDAVGPNIGPRYYHNGKKRDCVDLLACCVYSFPHFKAVLVNNAALFILFGKTSANGTTNNVSVLDVRNVSAIQFSDQFPLEGGSTALATENEAKSDEPAGLSSGAIAGIIVGAIAAVRL